MPLPENNTQLNARRAELRQELIDIKEAKLDLLKGGQEWSLSDRRFRGVQMADLLRMQREAQQELNYLGPDDSIPGPKFRMAIPVSNPFSGLN